MNWTADAKLEYLLSLPWTIRAETTPEGEHLLRVEEIPSAVACGTTDEALEADFWVSLRASLEAYLHFGDPVPTPAGFLLPWCRRGEHAGGSPEPSIFRRRVLSADNHRVDAEPSTGSFAKGRTEEIRV